jgi:large subunit ribosomal protein L2
MLFLTSKLSTFRFKIKYKTLYKTFSVFSYKTLPLLKSSVRGFVKSNGKNNTGKITCYHKGGGHKRSYRMIKVLNQKYDDTNGIITSIEYDPNRSCFVSSLFDFNCQKFFYAIAYSNCSIGDIVRSGSNAELYIGHVLNLTDIPEGTFVCNISDSSFDVKKYSRSAGTYATISEKTKTHCNVKLPSGNNKKLPLQSSATIGSVSTRPSSLLFSNKAGRSRWLNIRPTVRGVAMNPVDHPHGGGEGKKSGKKYTPWGKQTSPKKIYKKQL